MPAKNVVDHATPALTEAIGTNAEKISASRTHYNAMKASAEWASAPDVQKAAGEWSAATDNLEVSTKKVADLEKALAAARAEELVLVRRWTTKKDACLVAVDAYSDGSKDTVKNLGYGVAARQQRPPAGVPQDLLGKHGKVAAIATVQWIPGDGHRHTYQVQHCANTADAATYSAPLTVTRRTFKLAGQTPGATVFFRVRTLDSKLPTGETEWTAWVAVVVS